jgi:hypothetical protein
VRNAQEKHAARQLRREKKLAKKAALSGHRQTDADANSQKKNAMNQTQPSNDPTATEKASPIKLSENNPTPSTQSAGSQEHRVPKVRRVVAWWNGRLRRQKLVDRHASFLHADYTAFAPGMKRRSTKT